MVGMVRMYSKLSFWNIKTITFFVNFDCILSKPKWRTGKHALLIYILCAS